MLSVVQAHARVAAAFSALPAETLSLADAYGRVLAADVISRTTQPPADLSAMDGYAVRAADAATVPATLRIVGQAPAGGAYGGMLQAGEAVRIFTGGPLPAGADAIVIQEDTKAADGMVTVLEAPRAGRHIRRAGLDFRAGEAALAKGALLSARDIALAAGMNTPWLSVHRKPRVAIVATGDELVMPGDLPGPNQIVASSALAVAALVRAWGGDPLWLGVARDDTGVIAERMAAGSDCELLVTLGGASVGDHDLIRPALERLGYGLDFWKIAMRPGKPLMFAESPNARAKVLGLPGNPVSTFVCALLFLKPAIERLSGLQGDLPATVQAVLGADLAANDQREDYLRSRLERPAGGAPVVRPHPTQDSSMVSVLARADALLVRAPHDPARKAGDTVRIVDFRSSGLAL